MFTHTGKQDFVLTREVLQSVIEQDVDLARVFGVDFARGNEEEEELAGAAQQVPADNANLEVSRPFVKYRHCFNNI